MTETAQRATAPAQGVAVSIGLCFAVAVLEGFDIQAIGVAAPKLAADIGLSREQLASVFFASNLALVIGASFGGWLADRFGRKPVFVSAVVAFGVGTFATAFAHTLDLLWAARALAGLGFGAALPNMLAIAGDISRPDRRASTATMMFCGMPLGGGSCAALTQALPADFDWRLLFYVGGALPLVIVPALIFLMRETAKTEAKNDSARGNVLFALFGEGRTWPTLLLWLTFFPTLLVLYLILYWLPTLAIDIGIEPSLAPQASIAFNFASVAGALMIGWIVDRAGARWPLTIAYVVLAGVLLAFARASGLHAIVLLSVGAGFFLMGANYALYGVAASHYPRAVRGVGAGAAIAIGRVGAIIGPILPGLLWTTGKASADQVFTMMAPAAAAAAIAVFALGAFRQRAED